jgi:hypothetical protein
MRPQSLLALASTAAAAEFPIKSPPEGMMPGCTDTVSGMFDLSRVAASGLRKRDAPYPYPGQVRVPRLRAVLT